VPDKLTPGEGQDVLARFKRARERRDPDLMLELCSEDVEYRVDPFEPPLRGALAVREHWNRLAEEQMRVDFDAERIWVAGRTVLASWHGAFTRRVSGVRVRMRGFSTMELDDAGLVMRLREWPAWREVGIDGGYHPEEGADEPGGSDDGR
jgi:ketosteroid isomerase-like protein